MDGQNKRFNRNLDIVTTFQGLPNDLVQKVLQHLSLPERFRLTGICKAWRKLYLDGLVSIDIRKTVWPQNSQATIKSLCPLLSRNSKTLCSLTVHLDHHQCLHGCWDVCACKLPCIILLPRKHLLSANHVYKHACRSKCVEVLIRQHNLLCMEFWLCYSESSRWALLKLQNTVTSESYSRA